MSKLGSDLSSISLQQRAVLELWLKKKRDGSSRPARIPRRDDNCTAPLSFAQQRLWFLDQLEPGNQFYNCAVAARLIGKLNVGALERAFGEIIRRHEILRTAFPQMQGVPIQLITPLQPLNISVLDITDWSEQKQADEVLRLADEEAQKTFDLATGPLLRFRLLKLSEQEHVLLLVMHHILGNGWSTAIVVRELAVLYEAFSTGKPSQLDELPIQYADFAHWQHEWLQGEVLEELLSYWKQRLAGAPKVMELPTDRPRLPIQSFRGAKESFVLSEELSEGLRVLSRREAMSLFMTLLTAFQTLLSRYSGQDNIVVGSPFAVRNRAEIQEMIGFFANTLVLRTDLSGDPIFRELLIKVRKAVLEDYSHQDLPFERLVEELQPDRDMSRSPIFQTLFSLQNMPMPMTELPGLILSILRIDNRAARFDLHLAIEDTKQLSGWIEYNTDLFDTATIKRMAGHFQTLLESIVCDPLQRLSQLPMLTSPERHQLLVEFNDTASVYPSLCIHQLIEAQVERTPLAVALVFDHQTLTFRDLNQRANKLAHYLKHLGVGPEVLVGICLERSVEMVVALLAILKAGGAYVPIDPSYPHTRISFMIEDSGLNLLLTERHLVGALGQGRAEVVCIDLLGSEISRQDSSNLTCEVEGDNAAYVIYTSGSTGIPKGVQVLHGAVVNLLRSMRREPGISREDVLVAVTTLSFDIAALELYLPLIAGARLELASQEEAWDGVRLAERLKQSKATMMQATPSSWRMLMESGWRAEAGFKVLCGGEGLGAELARQLKESGGEVWNLYGPTETTIWSGAYKVEKVDRAIVPVGRPILNTQMYVLGEWQEVVPIGVSGEIYIGGEGLARGYLCRADQTAERFVPDPHSQLSGARMYRTGDEARYLKDGRIEYIGRLDRQVKVRGYRIELGEIEKVLNGHKAVAEAVAEVKEDKRGERRLVGYVVEETGERVRRDELIEYVKLKLPDYMVPVVYVIMEEMPLTPNGKVDRKALPEPDQIRPEMETEMVSPRTPVEERLAGIWAEVLGLERVGITDNFFARGGHSLLATQLISRVRDTFQVEVPLRRLFEQSTIAGLAEIIEAALGAGQGAQAPSIVRVSRDSELPLSFAQQRLWILDQLEPGSPFYNISAAMHMTGRINVEALQRSLGEIFQRHEVLRTTFAILDGRPQQVISAASPINIPLEDLSNVAECKVEAERIARVEAQQPFDLTRGPLLRVKLLRLSEDEHVLLFTLHHIAGDAWSMGVLGREVAALYGAYVDGMPSPLNPLPIQYVDFAYWQQHWLQGDILEKQLSYWRQQMAGAPPVLELPADRPRPAVQSFRGAKQSFVLSADTSQALKSLSRQEGVTLFMMLLAGFQILLHRYTDQPDIVTGSPIAGRNRAETEELIGFFVNTLVLRTDLSGNPTFSELLGRVREVCLGAYAHQDLPFEKLVEELKPKRDLSRAPLFQVMFGLINVPKTVAELRDLTLNIQQIDSKTAKFDLNLVLDDEERLTGSLEYNTDLFDSSTISRMLGHFQNLLKGLTLNPEQRIASLPLLGVSERKQVLEEWNDTARDSSSSHCIHHLFEAQALLTPLDTALIFNHLSLSYSDLNLRANNLAHSLIRLGALPESLVGICLDRSFDMVVALLAVLKAGSAYLPLDPRYPKDRLAWTISDANMQLLISQQSLLSSLPLHNARLICLDTDRQALALESGDNPQTAVTADNLAYVIYTSGSTGRPKGVAIEHRNTVAMLEWAGEVYSQQQMRGVLASTSICFDLSVFEIFAPLVVGGSVILAENALQLKELEAAGEVTLINTVPSAIIELMREGAIGKSVKTVNLAGEVLSRRVVDELYEGGSIERVYDLYGPTEDTTYTTCKLREAGGRATIGRGIRGEQIYILDKEKEPVPIGVVGEIYIAGRGVTRGYMGRAEATAEKYIPNGLGEEGGGRMYGTGDIGRWVREGEIEYVGRRDKQVKVRGYRIELGEIEEEMRRHKGVKEGVVEVREDERGEKRLVGYVVGEGEQEGVTTRELQEHLRERLPGYMMVSQIVMLEQMPMMPNGKVDRKALPEPDQTRPELEEAYTAPRTPNEEMLSTILAELLKIERVGIHDNFFDLGGHSLLAMQAISRACRVFHVSLPLRSIFENPTIAGLAERIEEAQRAEQELKAPPIERVSREATLQLSFAQERLWFLDQFSPGSPAYNISSAVRLTGNLDLVALEKSFNEIIRRHEALRTRFEILDGKPVQVIMAASPLKLEVKDISSLQQLERQQEVMRQGREEAGRGFDLSRGPMLRVRVLREGEQEHVLVAVMHHIVSDGWSMGVMIREVAALYEAYREGKESPLAELEIQYSDYAVWQREWLRGEELERQVEYWRKQLEGAPPLLELPTDRPRPAVQSYQGAKQSFILPETITEALRELSRGEGATLFMTLLAAFQVLLSRYTGQRDIVIGSPIAGRNRVETEGLIGFFVNTVVMRGEVEAGESFRELMRGVKEVAVGAYSHQEMPFEMLVEEIQPERSLSHSPLFQVWFVFQNADMPTFDLPDLTLAPLEFDRDIVRHDLRLELLENSQGIKGSFEYRTDLFDAATIARMIDHLEMLLHNIVAQPGVEINALWRRLDEADRQHRVVKEQEFRETSHQKLRNVRRRNIIGLKSN